MQRAVVWGALRPALSVPKITDRGAPPRSRPHVMIARYSYHAADASNGPSIEKFLLDNTLAAADAGTSEVFSWEQESGPFPRGDWALLSRCRQARPDMLVLSSYEPGYPAHPSIESIRLLKDVWRIPLVAVWWDTCWDGFWPSIAPLLPLVDLHVVPDNPLMNFFNEVSRREYGDRFLPLWEAMDPAIYHDPGWDRDVDVAFLGQTGGYRSVRSAYLQHLQQQEIPLACSTADRAQQPSHEEYIRTLKRAKIGLNFSQSRHSDQLKSRVFETISCGALLMENDNPQTRSYFEPMKDYVTFDSPADLVDKIRYFLSHPDERVAISRSGERRLREHFTCRAFWSAILDALAAVRRDA